MTDVPRTGSTTVRKLSVTHTHSLQTYHDAVVAPLIERIAALEAPVVVPPPVEPPPVEPPPVIPPGARVITPADSITALLASGVRSFLLRAGTYRESFGSGHRLNDGDVSLLPYPGDAMPVFDGTGLAPNFLYLGTGSRWTIGAIKWQGYTPTDSGIFGIGDGAHLTMRGTVIRGSGAIQQNKHAVYFHGTNCTGLLEDCDFEGVPGGALQSYRGAPVVTVNRGRYVGQTAGALMASGTWTINDAYLGATGTAFDVYQYVTGLTLNRCTGPAGAVRVYRG